MDESTEQPKPKPPSKILGRRRRHKDLPPPVRGGQPLALWATRRRLNEATQTGHASPAVREAKARVADQHAAIRAEMLAIAESMGLMVLAMIPPPDPLMTVTLHYDHVINGQGFRAGTHRVDQGMGQTLLEQDTRCRRMYAAEDEPRHVLLTSRRQLLEVGPEAFSGVVPAGAAGFVIAGG